MNQAPILLQGRAHDSLDWTQAKQEAQERVSKGEKIRWEIDLGLFSGLKHPLSHQAQFLSLCLSLEHFRDGLWKEFQEHTQDLIIYRGKADHSLNFLWNHEQIFNLQEWLKGIFEDEIQFHHETGIAIPDFASVVPEDLRKYSEGRFLVALFCRDACLQYVHLLTNHMPDELRLSVKLDMAGVGDCLLEALLSDREIYATLDVIVDGGVLQHNPQANMALCLPPKGMYRPSQLASVRQALQNLLQREEAYRIIPENYLITEWDGLDYLIVEPSVLSAQGKRKLQGFCAAGGTVLNAPEIV